MNPKAIAFILTILAVVGISLAFVIPNADKLRTTWRYYNDPPKGALIKSMSVNHMTRKYVVYVPASYDPDKPCPMIVYLHGMGSSGLDGWRMFPRSIGGSVLTHPDRWPFIVLCPQKRDPNINWEEDEQVVWATIERTMEEYNIDKKRVYLTGVSQGGHATLVFAAKHPDRFAAIAPLCAWGQADWFKIGRGTTWSDQEIAARLARMPIWMFHGEHDEVIPVAASRSMYRELKKQGSPVQVTYYPKLNHEIWDTVYGKARLSEWFLQHSK